MVFQPVETVCRRDFGPKRIGRQVVGNLAPLNGIPKKEESPFFLNMVHMCMDSYGNILHMPMGDYRAQNSFELGRIELRLMKFTKRVQSICTKSIEKRTDKEMSLIRSFKNV